VLVQYYESMKCKLSSSRIEALRASGWDQAKGHLMDIYDDYLKCQEVRCSVFSV
jgi:hypothetical protein